MYRIAWKHVGTGKVSRSIPLFSSLRVALQVAAQMDKHFPERHHRVEAVPPRRTEPASPEPPPVLPAVPGIELAYRLAFRK